MIATDSRPAMGATLPTLDSPAGLSSLSGHRPCDVQSLAAAEGSFSPQAKVRAVTTPPSPAGISNSRMAISLPAPKEGAPSGIGSLSGQSLRDVQGRTAAEGQDSPQATGGAIPMSHPPAGTETTPPAIRDPVANENALEGRETSHGQRPSEAHSVPAVAADLPGGQTTCDVHRGPAAGEQSC